jgi:hypothetical protein
MDTFATRIARLSKAAGGYRALGRLGGVSDSTIRRWIKVGRLPFGEKENQFAMKVGLTRRQLNADEPLPLGYVEQLEARRDKRDEQHSSQDMVAMALAELMRQNQEHYERQQRTLQVLIEHLAPSTAGGKVETQ